MPTISQLTAVTSVQDTDQVPVYSTDNGDARKAALSVLKAFFNTDPDYVNGTWTNPVLVFPDLGTPTYGNLINCIGLSLTTGVTGNLGLANGGTGASTADGALTNFGGTTIGKAVFTAATATDAQNALGATTVGKALFTAANAAAGRSAIGAAASGANSDITSLVGLTTAITPAQGGTGQVTIAAARTVFGSGVSSRKTANYTAVAGDVLACDTIAVGAFTVTLPASPVAGDAPIKIYDAGTTDTVEGFATNNLTIARNGNTICTLVEDVIVSTKGVTIILEYVNGTWRLYNG